jgi:hypothetical protein
VDESRAQWEDGLVTIGMWLAAALIAITMLVFCVSGAVAHMHDRPDLDRWFGDLASGKGLCCSFIDGSVVAESDWDTVEAFETSGVSGAKPSCHPHFRVLLKGEWVVVPDAAVITEPNKYGSTLVWPYTDSDGKSNIKCFIMGAGG